MKNLFLVLVLSIFISCETVEKKPENAETTENETIVEEIDYASFGEVIEKKDAIAQSDLTNLYLGLEVGDTIDVKFSSKINSVCKKKGCWMKLALTDEQEAMVRFKDYRFFVPKNSEGRDVIVEGYAFVEQTSIEDLKHYAEDDGASQEEIDAIVEPKITYAFTATGVLVQGTMDEFEGQVEPSASEQEETSK